MPLLDLCEKEELKELNAIRGIKRIFKRQKLAT